MHGSQANYSSRGRHDKAKRSKPASAKATKPRNMPEANFTASKKKTLESRKQSQMRYALTKPLAQMAMIASLATTTTAHSTEPTQTNSKTT